MDSFPQNVPVEAFGTRKKMINIKEYLHSLAIIHVKCTAGRVIYDMSS